MKHNFANPDIERYNRQNFPEAIYCPGKTSKQILSIAKKFHTSSAPVILTHANNKIFLSISKIFKGVKYHKICKIITIPSSIKNITKKNSSKNYVAIITAGTSDISVAEESACTLEFLGNKVERIYDVGVAGIHRLFQYRDKILNAKCVIVAAGMEGALPSIVGGLVRCPVIGLPTSIGYGSNFGGLTALFTMLNSCAANVCVVNVDDGFGAGIISHLIV